MTSLPESLSDKLRSLGVQTGPKTIITPPEKQRGIEDFVSGEFVNTTFGPVFCSESSTGNNYIHGNVSFQKIPVNKGLINWADSTVTSRDLDLSSLLFIDTETTGLSGGTGTIPFMIGVGRFSGNNFITSQIFLRNPAEERAQLELLEKFFSGITAMVTYNGKAFDVPIIKTRYTLQGITPPLSNILHFDLLPFSRRLWKRRLDNRSLKDIEVEILKFNRSHLEVPGWEVPILYFDYLRTGNPQPLVGVFYHNAVDIQSLAALFLLMNRMVDQAVDLDEFLPLDQFSLAVQYESSGDIDSAISIYEKLLLQNLPDQYHTELQLRYARILKRNGDFDTTISILNSDYAHIDIRVLTQRAKVLEHQYRNYSEALDCTLQALENLENSISSSISQYSKNQIKIDLEKRKDRLLQKLSKKTNL